MDVMKNLQNFRLPRLKCSRICQNNQTNRQIIVSSLCLLYLVLCTTTTITVQCQSIMDIEARPDTFYDNELHCKGEWKYPSNCSSFQCDYKASWEYQDLNDEIIFTISTKNRNKWTGIGFSDNQAMPETDAILGLVEESGRFFLMDSWLQAYEAPPLDQQQNLHNMTAWRENGVTTLRFLRPRQTGDSRDYQFSDSNCPYFIFPVMGGVFNAVNKRIRKHESTPIISDQRICIRSCKAPTTTTSTTSTTTTIVPDLSPLDSDQHLNSDFDSNQNQSVDSGVPDEVTKVYRVELKFYNLLNAQNKKINSESYNEMAGSLEENIYKELKPHFDRVRRVEVNEVIGQEEIRNDGVTDSSIAIAIVDITVAQARAEQDESQPLTLAMNSAIQDSLIGDASVDSNYLLVGKRDQSQFINMLNKALGGYIKFNDDEQKWIIIGAGISALVLLVLIQALCMFCRSRTSSDDSKQEDYIVEKDNVDKQWKEYTHDNYNMYNGYGGGGGGDEFEGYGAHAQGHHHPAKSNSLHKNYRGGHPDSAATVMNGRNYGDHHTHHHHQQQHLHAQFQSLDRRQFEQQQQQQQHYNRRNYNTNYEMNDRHHGHHSSHHHHPQPGPGRGAHHPSQLQPDFYFMPHQRKYSSDVVRVFVDYDEQRTNK